jgi:F-type H+-transporting ATPase subunit b
VRQESSDARNQLEEQLAANRQEVQQMIEQARQVAETERQQIAEQARQEADSLLARAKTEREQATEVAMQEVRQHFSELAITAAEKILQGSIDKNKHSELIENVLIEANEKQ